MGYISSSYIFPHPPIIVPEVGKGSEKPAAATIEAVKRAAGVIAEEKPSVIILVTPHAPMFEDYIYISTDKRLEGDFSQFGAAGVCLSYENNSALAGAIIKNASEKGIYAGGLEEKLLRKYNISKRLDYGALVPLYFVDREYSDFTLVHMSSSGLPPDELYRFGMCIQKAVEQSDERAVFIASGDLSHRLSKDAPYGYSSRGREYDEFVVDSVSNLKVSDLLSADTGMCESAGECGLRSFVIMFGAMDGRKLSSQVYSYQGPFGVGYMVARINAGEGRVESWVLEQYEQENAAALELLKKNEDPYTALARQALESYVRKGNIIKPPDDLPHEMLERQAGVFVSLKLKGQLRGCIGTIGPTRKNIAQEIIYNTISAGTQDPRFYPVGKDELDRLVYSVDVLKEPEAISSIGELDVVKYGVIVTSKGRSGLLLPNLEGVDTPEKQLEIAMEKAGIKPSEQYSLQRFEVIRHK